MALGDFGDPQDFFCTQNYPTHGRRDLRSDRVQLRWSGKHVSLPNQLCQGDLDFGLADEVALCLEPMDL